MIASLVEFALIQQVLVFTLGLTFLVGGLCAFHIVDILAYPDLSPPMVEVITQYQGVVGQGNRTADPNSHRNCLEAAIWKALSKRPTRAFTSRCLYRCDTGSNGTESTISSMRRNYGLEKSFL
jgi:hypothetical protein